MRLSWLVSTGFRTSGGYCRVKKRKFGLGLGAAAMGVAAMMLTSGTAQAASWGPRNLYSDWPSTSVKVGTAMFKAYGDGLRVCDSRRDGYGPAINVYRASDFKLVWHLKVTTGTGTCAYESKNLSETTKYEFWADVDSGGDYRLMTTTAGGS
jgi:hypothetical protein